MRTGDTNLKDERVLVVLPMKGLQRFHEARVLVSSLPEEAGENSNSIVPPLQYEKDLSVEVYRGAR